MEFQFDRTKLCEVQVKFNFGPFSEGSVKLTFEVNVLRQTSLTYDLMNLNQP